MEDDFAERLMAKIQDRIETELDSIGVDMVEQIRDTLSVPVERQENGFVIRSDPGEDPRREYGHLWESEGHDMPDPLTLEVFNTASYAKRLNYGDGDKLAPRPFHEHAKAFWFPQIRGRLLEAITGKR